ncbi:hypothetical protein ACFFJT_08510 [Dyella flava]|uniref:Uncharacterized protein n=1 Tax=Dyella flava TaxID=1920170 RepID=A0ABS2K915_9GAMM|nr:hypothetical protein [Dyella flava]MBM7127631.1 hypothetical protein [Dyella flava]
MSSVRRKRSILLTFCALIALLLMSSHVATSAHARITALLHDTAPCLTVSVDIHATNGHGSLQRAITGDDSGAFVDDHDADDELVLPSSVRVRLDYLPSAAPLNADASLHPAPVKSPLRPPSFT